MHIRFSMDEHCSVSSKVWHFISAMSRKVRYTGHGSYDPFQWALKLNRVSNTFHLWLFVSGWWPECILCFTSWSVGVGGFCVSRGGAATSACCWLDTAYWWCHGWVILGVLHNSQIDASSFLYCSLYFHISVQKALKHRRVKHYGYEFRYDNNNVDKDKPLPGGKYKNSTFWW